MIKVNLLRDQAVRVRRKLVAPTISRTGLALVSFFILLAAGLGVWWFAVSREITRLTETRQKLQVESNALEKLKKDIAEYEKLKKIQEARIQVMEQLKEAQTGPVQLLNHVIRSIPRNSALWLTLIDQKGDRIQIVGNTLRSESIPDFMINLASNGVFKTVDLELIQEEKESSKFSLICISARKAPTE